MVCVCMCVCLNIYIYILSVVVGDYTKVSSDAAHGTYNYFIGPSTHGPNLEVLDNLS